MIYYTTNVVMAQGSFRGMERIYWSNRRNNHRSSPARA